MLVFLSCIVAASALESRIYNGGVLRPEIHGYLVLLQMHASDRFLGACSGSIVDQNWIVTSAHCFNDPTLKSIIVSQDDNTVKKKVLGTVNSGNIIKHPLFIDNVKESENRAFDIALLKTTEALSLGENISTIDLAKLPPQVGQSAIIAGYGQNELENSLPQEGSVVISKCSYNLEGILCSNDTARAGDGDSGGALLSRGKLVGVTSGSCTNADNMDHQYCVTVYTSIAAHYDWISSVMSLFVNT